MTETRTETKFLVSDLANARRLVDLYGSRFRYVSKLHQWLTWDGRRWAEDSTGEIDRWAKGVTVALADDAHLLGDTRLFSHAIKSQNTAAIANMIKSASTESGVSVQVSELDCDPWSFNVRNGTLDLRTGELHDHRPDDLITKLSNVEYDPEAQCPVWLETLSGIFSGDSLMVTCLQRFVGYCLTGEVSQHVMVFGTGNGANGKTTVSNAIRSILGDYSISLAADVLIDTGRDVHTTGITDLLGARFVVATETARGRRFNEALLKSLTGNDPIKARRMHSDFIEFLPTHKIFMHGNHKPRIIGTDWGFWRRLKLMPFEVQFAIDPTLEKKLLAEASGILAWAVQGCLDYQRDGLLWPNSVEEATQNYRESQDHVGRFIAETCEAGETLIVTTKALRAEYEAWCKDQGEHAWPAKEVGLELSRLGYVPGRSGTTGRYWKGIGLTNDGTLK